jgi:seryl-tRNA synthetase
MLDLAMVRTEPERIIAALARRGLGPEAVREVVELDARWTGRQEVREALRQRRRRASEEVARARGEGRDTAALEAAGRQVSAELAAVEAEMGGIEARRQAALEALPNLPATDTPDQVAEVPAAGTPAWRKPFAPLHHADLLEMLGLAATAASAGRGFLVWRGRGARLLRAVTDFMLDVHTREFGCEEVRVPALATRAALTASAHLPLLEDKMYILSPDPHAPGGMPTPSLRGHASAPSDSMPTGPAPWACHPASENDLFLAPRAEPHLASLYAGCLMAGAQLPERFVAAGPAFRREAGGRGAAGRGLMRLHEFPTVEVYVFCRPDQADAELARAVAAAEAILARLEVPHRRRLRPAPGLSRAAAKTVDLDVWAPGTKQWLGAAAISSFTDYQSRRTNTRFSSAGPIAAPRLVHTVGGAAVALPHLVAALLENGQEADGSVRLPAALIPYFGEGILRASASRNDL